MTDSISEDKKEMFVKYFTREGRFNWCNTSEVSYSCNVKICDMNANILVNCNFTPERELNGTDIDEIIAEIQESISRYWTTSDDRKDFVTFAEKNHDNIIAGTRKRRIAEIKTELDALNEEKERLESKL